MVGLALGTSFHLEANKQNINLGLDKAERYKDTMDVSTEAFINRQKQCRQLKDSVMTSRMKINK